MIYYYDFDNNESYEDNVVVTLSYNKPLSNVELEAIVKSVEFSLAKTMLREEEVKLIEQLRDPNEAEVFVGFDEVIDGLVKFGFRRPFISATAVIPGDYWTGDDLK